MTRYAELLCKTNFSYLRGASHPGEYIERAARLGVEAVALTDIGGVYGIPRAYLAQKSFPGVKLISGAELPIENHPSIALLAQDRSAYGLLCRILTSAHQNRPKADPLISLRAFLDFLRVPQSRGLIAIARDGARNGPGADYAALKDIFQDRLVLPVFRFLDGKDAERLAHAKAVSDFYGIPLLASNDVHFHARERGRLQDVVTSIREGVPCKNAGFRLFSNSERYLKSPEQMRRLFAELPDALTKSVELAERCTFSPGELRYRYPSEWIPKNHTAQSYLEELTWKGASERYRGMIPVKVEHQLRNELKIIQELQFADYFLTVEDIVRWAREQGILCQGRGSAANSSVCFCLGITAVDPVRMRLLFERFISPERGEPPDIDVDFEHERREEVIQYVYQKYGRDRAAMVSAVITYRSRSALREVAKALGVEVGTLSARKVEALIPELVKEQPRLQAQIEELTSELRGFPRHLSIHSGAFTLSADPITEIVPVEPATMPGRTIVQWDKNDLDILGLLKVDLLSLGMLSALKKTLRAVNLELHQIPQDDPATYKMIQKADTVGTFQIESRAQMSMLPRLLPKTFYDLVIQVAIVRPGPIVGQMVHPFLKRRRGLEPVALPHPKLEPILGRTLGVPLFQEQIMQLAVTLGGFTPGEADQLRRAIGAWRSAGSVEAVAHRLKQRLRESGLPESFVDTVFQQMKGFAEYGFPESHAASFALLAYASAYLKCHHPAEFCCALLNSQPMGFYHPHTLIDDAKRHGVTVLAVDPQVSDWDCALEKKNTIRLGLRLVHGISKREALTLIDQRRQRPFANLSDFITRAGLKRGVIRTLALGDAFRSFGFDQRNAFWSVLGTDWIHAAANDPQLNLFNSADSDSRSPRVFSPMGEYEAIHADYESFGVSVRGHPMQAVRKHVKGLPRMTSRTIKALPHDRVAEIGGLAIVMQRPPTAKGTVFATLEDEDGFLDLILWKKVFEQYRELILNYGFLIVRGRIQRDGHSVSMLVQSIRVMPQFSEDIPRSLSEGVLLG